MPAQPEIIGDRLRVSFAPPWPPADYELFLRTKRLPHHELSYDEVRDLYTLETSARFAPVLGLEPPRRQATRLEVPDHLFDYQRHFLDIALRAKRFAAWWDTGLGKTILELEWARQVHAITGGRVLLVFPLNLIPQALEMARQFYGEDDLRIERLEDRPSFRAWCEGIASFLETVRKEGEVFWTFFARDNKTGEWRLRQHAICAFYRFLSGWSCYLRSPARFGFDDNLRDLPAPERIVHEIEPTDEQLAALARVPDAEGQTSLLVPQGLGLVERGIFGQLASGFLYGDGDDAARIPSDKPGFVARLVAQEVEAGRPTIIWTLYDETAAILEEMLERLEIRCSVLTGKVPKVQRPGMVRDFVEGEVDVLLTRPALLAFGWNLQAAKAMVFADLNDSFETVYQAERRCYRYGQTEPVRIHFPVVQGLQDAVWENLERKREAFERDISAMEGMYLRTMEEFSDA